MKTLLLRIKSWWYNINWYAERKKPTRGTVLAITLLILVILIFYLFWLFDARAIFPGDVAYKPYSTLDIVRVNWSWFRKGLACVSILATLGWVIAILNELLAYHARDRTFHKFYR